MTPSAQDLSIAVEVNFNARWEADGALLDRPGYGYSVQSALPTDKYERSSFIEMLVDWGWSGPIESIPAWLSEIDTHE